MATSPFRIAALFLSISCSVLASPIERRGMFISGPLALQTSPIATFLLTAATAIDPATFANLELFEQFAAAAYCPGNANDTDGGLKVTCPVSNNCPLVEADDAKIVYGFQK